MCARHMREEWRGGGGEPHRVSCSSMFAARDYSGTGSADFFVAGFRQISPKVHDGVMQVGLLFKVVVFLTALIYTQTSKRVTATITVTRDLHFRHLEIENDPK